MMNSSTRNYLRRIAHNLQPAVMVGKKGVDEGVVKALDEALIAHELVKVRFQDFKDEVRPLAEELTKKVNAAVVTTVGHVAIVFRQNENPDDQIIHIPDSVTD